MNKALLADKALLAALVALGPDHRFRKLTVDFVSGFTRVFTQVSYTIQYTVAQTSFGSCEMIPLQEVPFYLAKLLETEQVLSFHLTDND